MKSCTIRGIIAYYDTGFVIEDCSLCSIVYPFSQMDKSTIKVIGNKFDNPELMENLKWEK